VVEHLVHERQDVRVVDREISRRPSRCALTSPASRRLGQVLARRRHADACFLRQGAHVVLAGRGQCHQAAEAAEVDIAGGLAIAVLAVIAVLPEYAVDLYFAYTAGSRPEHVQFAAANMTGSNRLLLGLGWSLVVLLALFRRAPTQRSPRSTDRPQEPTRARRCSWAGSATRRRREGVVTAITLRLSRSRQQWDLRTSPEAMPPLSAARHYDPDHA
jgi:hypothetical protein